MVSGNSYGKSHTTWWKVLLNGSIPISISYKDWYVKEKKVDFLSLV